MGERLAFTFALTGRREWGHGTQGVALGSELVGLSARAGLPVCPELVAPAPLKGRVFKILIIFMSKLSQK